MELWRSEGISEARPAPLSTRTLGIALALHVGVFVLFWIFALLHFKKAEEVIPIDLTVIVNENLDGKEDEPPPLQNPTPEQPPEPPPEPEAPKKIEPPKALEQIVTNIVEKKEAEKKPEPPKEKKPEPPKKTAEERKREREKRLAEMRKSAVQVKGKKVQIEVKNAPSGDGRTARQTMTPAQIRALLNQGYRPGVENQIASSVKQRCLSLIQRAINEKWDRLGPRIGREGTVILAVQFNSAGGMINVRLAQSCGDRMSDEAALSVARQVTSIPGLDPGFIAEFARTPLNLQYNVKGR